jgi:hypothetical protein
LNPPDEQFTVSAAESYRAMGDIVVDGEVKLAFEAVETATGERYLVVEEPGVRSEHYQSSPNASVYERIAVEHGDAERLRGEITGDEDRRLLWKNRTRERVVFVVEENTTDLSRSLTGPASVVVRSLHVASYESGGDSSNASVYEPRNGWYDGTEPYRVTAASGEVRTRTGSHAVESATVTWETTTPAGSYAEYALTSLFGTAPRTYTISYEFAEGSPELDRPEWATEMRLPG